MTDRRSMTSYLVVAAVILILSEFLMNTKVEANSSWWSLGLYGCDSDTGSAETMKICLNCASMEKYGLTTQEQAAQCSVDSGPVRSIARGARYAILDCQRRFNASKWNCSTFQNDIFGKFIDWNTPETALLHSYFIAGATWSLATDCQRQMLVNCPCIKGGRDRQTNENGDILFYTCDANVNYAKQYLDSFVLNGEIQNGSLRGMLDWSNGNVGYNVAKKQEQTCHCHGISGTCSSQTCHQKVQSVEEVGEELVEKYGEAEKVDQSAVVDTADGSNINVLKFQKESPNFCVMNSTIGVLGVSGRQCELNHPTHNCSSLCCGRGWTAITENVPIKECKFIWCCSVECPIVRHEFVVKTYCN